jgi:hypothetical protein
MVGKYDSLKHIGILFVNCKQTMANEREEKVLFNEEFPFSHSTLRMARTKSQIRDGNIVTAKTHKWHKRK